MTNSTAEATSGTDLSSWVGMAGGEISCSLKDAATYRTAEASKAMPALDVNDYSQENYVFDNTEMGARHWNTFLLDIFEKYANVLKPLYFAATT